MVFPRTESTYGCSDRGGPERPRSRCDGIALMVVMVVFIVLYMMVYHLSFYTVMEEKIAHVRHGDIQGQDALYSVAQLVMAQLTEDIVQDYSGGAEDPAAAAPGRRAPGRRQNLPTPPPPALPRPRLQVQCLPPERVPRKL